MYSSATYIACTYVRSTIHAVHTDMVPLVSTQGGLHSSSAECPLQSSHQTTSTAQVPSSEISGDLQGACSTCTVYVCVCGMRVCTVGSEEPFKCSVVLFCCCYCCCCCCFY